MNSCILDMKIPESKVTVVTQTSYQQQDSTIRPPTNDDGGSVTPYNTPIPSAYISPATNAEYPESSSHVFTLQGQQDNGALSMAPAESSLLSPEYGLEQTVPDYTNQISLWESDYGIISAADSPA
ncbi:predicted protein [Aspergillus nidulans FGSC A4]|uniref:Uncharacterized protein n=1 Tax=Emericella nidulans (strain FGSC A4 / ATCC 38163 / CBS 112.46 / NRRL 194 / M139) TaxID=227321 RepID=Q5AX64_EMENI|nr:hypothetical protein [Aspergillus nidulans FGSC A4]EAA61321.1 predicted protein [Aspergillus nidulans FGSC A4]CBF79050.1 TPA: conserved hypothetical protein [Aspergillus nidulans FGSC A4]|eukprot:XP_664720.1 predicted protein [Aspergillus nidulans FGSC A4]